MSNLFRTAPGTDEWPIISAGISSGFQDVKKRWFSECVMAMELGLFADKTDKAKVFHTELGGAGALAITGYQICCASSVIPRNGYVSKSSTKEFVDLLCGRVSGVETSELLRYIRRYDAANNEASTQRFKFGVDVARYVINDEPSMMISVQVASLAEKLFTLTCIVIANAFDDSARAHKLSRQIASLEMQLRPNG
ncbi:MAG: hypothetical protein AABN34_02705 [Acidobacteriota bacterium]